MSKINSGTTVDGREFEENFGHKLVEDFGLCPKVAHLKKIDGLHGKIASVEVICVTPKPR